MASLVKTKPNEVVSMVDKTSRYSVLYRKKIIFKNFEFLWKITFFEKRKVILFTELQQRVQPFFERKPS